MKDRKKQNKIYYEKNKNNENIKKTRIKSKLLNIARKDEAIDQKIKED